MSIQPTRKRVLCRKTPIKEQKIWTPSPQETVSWEVLAVGEECPGIEVGMHVLVMPRAPAFETPSDSLDEAFFKFEDIFGVDESFTSA